MHYVIILIFFAFPLCCQSEFYKKRNRFRPKSKNDLCYGIECTSSSFYPEKYINRMVNKKKMRNFFGKIIEPSLKPSLTLRSDFDDEDGKNVCDFKENTAFPKIAKDVDLNLRFIVNTKEHKQGITYQICASKKAFINNMLLNYHFFCRQNYSTVRLIYVNEDGQLNYGKFPVPSACVCSYKMVK